MWMRASKRRPRRGAVGAPVCDKPSPVLMLSRSLPRLYPPQGRGREPRLPFARASRMMPAMTLPLVRYPACTLFALLAACTAGKPALHATAGLAQGTTYSLQWTGGPADVDE